MHILNPLIFQNSTWIYNIIINLELIYNKLLINERYYN